MASRLLFDQGTIAIHESAEHMGQTIQSPLLKHSLPSAVLIGAVLQIYKGLRQRV